MLSGDTPSEFDVDETTRSSGGLDADMDSEMMLLSSSSSAAASSAAANAQAALLLAAGSKKPAECVCPNCQRNMAASRFAPHLEKCMGMGRNSSRLASRRIATSATRQVSTRNGCTWFFSLSLSLYLKKNEFFVDLVNNQ